MSLVAVLAQAPVHAQPVDDDCARLAPDARIAPLARFSNMRYTEEHAYGYDVLLWQAGDCLVGMLQHSEGLIGDTPMGLLESVEFDPSTGAIAFAAKLTMGLKAAVEDGEAVYRPSRDYFTFSGALDLSAGTLAGEIEQTQDGATAAAETLTLSATGDSTALYPNAANYGQWLEQLAPLLRARGPKW